MAFRDLIYYIPKRTCYQPVALTGNPDVCLVGAVCPGTVASGANRPRPAHAWAGSTGTANISSSSLRAVHPH